MGNSNNNQYKKKAGYEYLLAYKLTIPIYDLTVEFVKKYIDYKSRTPTKCNKLPALACKIFQKATNNKAC